MDEEPGSKPQNEPVGTSGGRAAVKGRQPKQSTEPAVARPPRKAATDTISPAAARPPRKAATATVSARPVSGTTSARTAPTSAAAAPAKRAIAPGARAIRPAKPAPAHAAGEAEQLVEATNVTISRGGAGEVEARSIVINQGGIGTAAAEDITVSMGGIGMAQADDIAVRMGAVGMARGEHVSSERGYIGFAVGRDVSVTQGYARAILANDVHIRQGGAGTIIAANVTLEKPSGAFLLVARKVEGDVRAVLDWRGALAAGAALGIAIGLLARRRHCPAPLAAPCGTTAASRARWSWPSQLPWPTASAARKPGEAWLAIVSVYSAFGRAAPGDPSATSDPLQEFFVIDPAARVRAFAEIEGGINASPAAAGGSPVEWRGSSTGASA